MLITLPKTNSSPPETKPGPKRKWIIIFHPINLASELAWFQGDYSRWEIELLGGDRKLKLYKFRWLIWISFAPCRRSTQPNTWQFCGKNDLFGIVKWRDPKSKVAGEIQLGDPVTHLPWRLPRVFKSPLWKKRAIHQQLQKAKFLVPWWRKKMLPNYHGK